MSMQNFQRTGWDLGRHTTRRQPWVLGSLGDQRQSPREWTSPCWLCSTGRLSTGTILVSDQKHVCVSWRLTVWWKNLNWLENWFLSYPVYIAEVMKLPIKLEFHPDPVLRAGWELVLFTKAPRRSASKRAAKASFASGGHKFFHIWLDE